MYRRQFVSGAGVVLAAVLAGCSSDENDDDSGEDATEESQETTTEEQTLTHEIGASFTVGEEEKPIQYVVKEWTLIEDYIADPGYGQTPDGTFVVVTLEIKNVGEETVNMYSDNMKLLDDEDREFDADERAFYLYDEPRIEAEDLGYEELQPGLGITRAEVFDVPPGTYRLAVEPLSASSNAETHYVPLGEV